MTEKCATKKWGMRATYICLMAAGLAVFVYGLIVTSDAAAGEKLSHWWSVASGIMAIFLGIYAWIFNLFGEVKEVQGVCTVMFTVAWWHFLIVIACWAAIGGIVYGIYTAL